MTDNQNQADFSLISRQSTSVELSVYPDCVQPIIEKIHTNFSDNQSVYTACTQYTNELYTFIHHESSELYIASYWHCLLYHTLILHACQWRNGGGGGGAWGGGMPPAQRAKGRGGGGHAPRSKMLKFLCEKPYPGLYRIPMVRKRQYNIRTKIHNLFKH